MTVTEDAARDALVERLLGACIGGLDLLHDLGDKLGLSFMTPLGALFVGVTQPLPTVRFYRLVD
jgi:hypothetical protein